MAHVHPLNGHLFGEDQPCFGCGPKHPFGFRLRFDEEGEDIVTRYTPTHQHQGPIGVMHGGLVTTLADECAAWVILAKLGKFGFTTSFEARLRRPVRIGVEAEGRAWLTKRSPRVVRVAATVSQAGEECYRADFTFAILAKKAAEQLMGIELQPEWERYCR